MPIQPFFFGDGYTPRRSDPKRVVWCKKLGEYQEHLKSSGLDLATNNPEPNDTIRILNQKLLFAMNGIKYTG